MVDQMQIDEPMFAGHGPKMPVSQSRDARSGVIRLSKEEGFELVQGHGSQYLREVNRLHSIENLFQILWDYLFTLTRIVFRESRASNFRPPTQGLGKEVQDVTQRFLLHHGRVRLEEPHLLLRALWANHFCLAPVSVVSYARRSSRED